MFIHELATPDPRVLLVKPDVARDASLGVAWLEGEEGRKTLELMGVAPQHNNSSTLEEERVRVTDFLENPDSRVWMIQFDGKVVGAIWIDLKPTPHMPAPSLHLMIGDVSTRGKGVGSAAYRAVLDWLRTTEALYPLVYTRHIASNKGSEMLTKQFGYQTLGPLYTDEDGLEWQNYYLQQQRIMHHIATKAIIIKDKSVLLLQQAEDPSVEKGGKYHPPGGIVEPGESVRDALVREVAEETSLQVEVGELLGIDEWQADIRGSYCQFCGIFFMCTIAADSPELRIDTSEVKEARWVSLDTFDKQEILEPSRSIIYRLLKNLE